MERRDGEARQPAQRARPRVAGQIEHSQTPRQQQNPCFGRDLKACPCEHPSEGAPRIRLLETVPIQPVPVQQYHQKLAHQGIPTIRHSDHRAAPRSQHAKGSPGWPRPCPRSVQPFPWNRSRRSSQIETAAPAHRTTRRATSDPGARSFGWHPGRSPVRYRPRRHDSGLLRPSSECACSSPHPRDRYLSTRRAASGARWVRNNPCSSSRYCAVDRAPCRSETSIQHPPRSRGTPAPHPPRRATLRDVGGSVVSHRNLGLGCGEGLR